MLDKAPVTDLLLSIKPGESVLQREDRLFRRVYEDLHALASNLMRGERSDHTLQPTALVHEAFLRLVDADRVGWESRAHFFGAAARAMRRVLVDHARKKRAAKRNPRGRVVTIEASQLPCRDHQIDLIVLDDLLVKLAELDPRMAVVAELRVFGGLRRREMARLLDVSVRTVDGDWAMAKKWLRREMA